MKGSLLEALRITISGISGMQDNGEVALLIGVITGIKNYYPAALFNIGLINGQKDEPRIKQVFSEINHEIKLFGPLFSANPHIPWYIRKLLLLPKYIAYFIRSDIVIHIGADGYSDDLLGGPLSTLTHSYQLLLGRILGKPVVACAQSIGPFNRRLTRQIGLFTLNNVNLITARERITQAYLVSLGVKNTIHLVADQAFLVKQTSQECIQSIFQQNSVPLDKPLVSLVLSQVVHKKIHGVEDTASRYELYIRAMAEIADYLAGKGFNVVIPCQTVGGKHDDTVVAKRVHSLTRVKPSLLLTTDLTPQELKGVLAACQMVISSKMHSAILATSAGTPTVVIGSHYKIRGIIGEMMGQDKLIVDITSSDFSFAMNKLQSVIDNCWTSRKIIRSELVFKHSEIIRLAEYNIELIVRLIESQLAKRPC